MVDPTKGWEHLWQQPAVIRRGWDRPSEKVVVLAARLRGEGARQALDLGCGPGRHAVALARLGYAVAATDVSPTALAHCRAWLTTEGLTALLSEADMRALPFPRDVFDLVIAYNVIYHATRAGVAATLAEIARVLRPGGHLFVTFIATEDAKCADYRAKTAAGRGIELEPNTFRVPDDPDEDGDLPHHFVDEAEARDLLAAFDVLAFDARREERLDSRGTTERKVHWDVWCRRRSGSAL